MAAAPGSVDGGGKAPGDGPLLAGRWRLGQRMGAGNQAETYLATEVARRVEVVVKRVKLGAGWKSFELHERETKVLGQLRHPGVPRLLGAVAQHHPGAAGGQAGVGVVEIVVAGHRIVDADEVERRAAHGHRRVPVAEHLVAVAGQRAGHVGRAG